MTRRRCPVYWAWDSFHCTDNSENMRQAVFRTDDDVLAEFGFSVFRDAGVVDLEILSCEGPRGVSRLHLEERPDEGRLDAVDTIQWWERVSTEGSAYVYLVEMDVTQRLEKMGVDADGILRAERAEVHERGFSFEQVGPQERISDMVADLAAAELDVTLQKLRDYRVQETPLDALTDRQREVLDVAYSLGYYDVPRRSSTTDVAAELGVDDSTVSEHLQRAERNLLETILD